jgi:hypothetical protein
MLHTMQIIFYSFIIIFIGHYLYNFYNDNFVDKTIHNIHYPIGTATSNIQPRKIHIYDDNNHASTSNTETSNSMKNELQNFLKSQIHAPLDNINNTRNIQIHDDVNVGTTNIEDIPISV